MEYVENICQTVISLIPLGAVALCIIKSFQIDAIDLVFMRKERKTYMTVIQCVFCGFVYGFYIWVLSRLIQSPYHNDVLFGGALIFCAVLYLLMCGIYIVETLNLDKGKCKLLRRFRAWLTSSRFNTYFKVTFVVFLLLLGYALTISANLGVEKEALSVYSIAFSIMISLYIFFGIKVSNRLFYVRIWFSLNEYKKIYILYKIDKNTFLCEIPCTDNCEEKQYMCISLKEILDCPLHIEEVHQI